MTDGHDVNKLFTVGDSIDHAPLTNPDAPKVSCALNLDCASGPGFAHQQLNVFENAQCDRGIKGLKLFARRTRKDNSEFNHATCAWLWLR